jgi:hypothetical protein
VLRRIRRAKAANPIGGAAAARARNLVGVIQAPTWLAQVTLNQIFGPSGSKVPRLHCAVLHCEKKGFNQ